MDVSVHAFHQNNASSYPVELEVESGCGILCSGVPGISPNLDCHQERKLFVTRSDTVLSSVDKPRMSEFSSLSLLLAQSRNEDRRRRR